MDILFLSARYIYCENNSDLSFFELPLFKEKDFANKIRDFSQKGDVIVFIDVWRSNKKHNKELVDFFGKEQERGEILFLYSWRFCKKVN